MGGPSFRWARARAGTGTCRGRGLLTGTLTAALGAGRSHCTQSSNNNTAFQVVF
jgi:hypothetical protein